MLGRWRDDDEAPIPRGGAIVVIALIGGVVWLFQEHPAIAGLLVIGIPIAIGTAIASTHASPKPPPPAPLLVATCGVCGGGLPVHPILRRDVGGVRKRVCERCARELKESAARDIAFVSRDE